ncbi:glycoside hydrolase family 3 protein, partial [Anaerolineae bacterium CFX9]|nr:glycoside hydrolase family 3 protein [Anaerolineae bacterium CFX9]
MIMHSFKNTIAPPEILDGVRRGEVPAFCLFKHYNVESPAQLRELSLALYAAAREGGLPPPLVGIDQEGGQLIAVTHGATELPGNMALGATRSAALAEAAGRVLGRELLAMGINMNFAPSLDINTNPKNPAIGVRSFGDDPALVSELGVALIRGMQAEGVIATAKHFPGHGDTEVDSHYGLPTITHTAERIRAVELAPFRAAIEAGVEAIMTAHILTQALDPDHPGTLSHLILTRLLREELGFKGLIVTDALDMHAVAVLGHSYIVRRSLEAGADLAMLGHLPHQFELTDESRPLWTPESIDRIRRARESRRTELPPLSVVGSPEHQAIAQQIADASVTLTHGTLPLRLGETDKLAVITVQPRNLTPADSSATVRISLPEAVVRRHANTQALEIPRDAEEAEIRAALEACADARAVVIGTIDAYRDTSQQALVSALAERGQAVYVVALRTPYDAAFLPQAAALLCVYSVRAVSCEAAA